MPHHVIGRLRSWPLQWDELDKAKEPPRLRNKDKRVAVAIEVCDITGGVCFLVGSFCFLPSISHRLIVFLAGCALFIVGGVFLTAIAAFNLVESVREVGWKTHEACENLLFLVANIIFLAGTILYWPEEAHYVHIEYVKEFSLGVYFNLFTPEFEGTLLFILGSVLMFFAAFVNGLGQGRGQEGANAHAGLFSATTSLNMAGALLFVVGSFAFLPDMGVTEEIVTLGAWCYIIGSGFMVIASSISLSRILWHSQDPERKPLVDSDSTAQAASKAAAIDN
eukprot:TRINITY_DN124550_c0_g1_i1.p1 TRINITY_DN124550_c0_g1~~TRINITY_DN124550_c0_g1_i1.p1  ORF type:complete len:279 (-),score=40.22 TRINITY_DN124550_c0_g1_i1:96-932(-)